MKKVNTLALQHVVPEYQQWTFQYVAMGRTYVTGRGDGGLIYNIHECHVSVMFVYYYKMHTVGDWGRYRM